MVKCILKGKQDIDAYSGKTQDFQTIYNGIPEACSMWASGYKHCFLYECSLFYLDSGIEVPEHITDQYYDRYYYGRFIFDENGEECGRRSWQFTHIKLYFPFGIIPTQICEKKTGVLLKKK